MAKENRYLIRVSSAQTFLRGQLELYKIEFVETDCHKYLDVMNDLNETLETVKRMDKLINRLIKENKQLKNER